MSSFPLTNSYFSRWERNHQPDWFVVSNVSNIVNFLPWTWWWSKLTDIFWMGWNHQPVQRGKLWVMSKLLDLGSLGSLTSPGCGACGGCLPVWSTAAGSVFKLIFPWPPWELMGSVELHLFLLLWMTNDVLVGGLEHFLFFHILGIIIPTEFHIFQRGGSTTNQCFYVDSEPGSEAFYYDPIINPLPAYLGWYGRENPQCQWIGLRENLQESPIFNGKIYGFRLRFSLKPIQSPWPNFSGWWMIATKIYVEKCMAADT